MIFDVMLPATLFLITLITIFTYEKYEKRFRKLFEEKTLSIKDVVLLVVVMGVMVTLIVFVPQRALIVIFLFAYSMLMFIFTYVAVPKWYIAIIPSIIFVALYVGFNEINGFGNPYIWEYGLMNIYAAIFAIMVTTYIGNMFTWKTTLVFAVLLTIMDVIQVLYTERMVIAARYIEELKLPMLIKVPTIPPIFYKKEWVFSLLGIGDLFFAGLLATQTMRRFDRKHALIAAIGITVSFFLFELLMFNYWIEALPGTLMIVIGWATVIAVAEIRRLARRNAK